MNAKSGKLATILLMLLCAAFAAGCGDNCEECNTGDGGGKSGDDNEVSFATTDGVTVFADYVKPDGATKAVILVHDKGQDRGVWKDLAAKLNAAGYATLAVDLRGHGKSVKQGDKTLDYRDFSDMWTGDEGKTWMMDCYKDVEAAVKFVELKGFEAAKVAAIGAGEGADILSQYRGHNPTSERVTGFVFFSPEIRDHGSTIKDVGPANGVDEKIFFYYCSGDTDCGEYEGNKMYKKMSEIAEYYKSQFRQMVVARPYEGKTHGTAMLEMEGVMDRIIEDIDSQLN